MKRSPTTRCAGALVALLAVVTLLAAASPASAIPAFARKYATSCQTCHIAYPKLNSYGEAFRLLGYRLPGETEEQVKQPDTSLGAEAYKRVWPDAVWPGAIPAHVPLALTAEFLVQSDPETDYDFIFPSEVALVAAGTAGENVSYFGEIGFAQEVEDGQTESEASVEHIDFRFIRPLRGSLAFNVKIGSFQPELVSTFDHARRLTVANYDSMFGVRTLELGGAAEVGGGHGHGGGGGIALPAIARGFEGYGVVAHRFLWSAGVVNGLEPGQDTFDANDRKDVYGRVAYKWGGLAADGANADTFAASAKNWRESSFRLGVFAYLGDASDVFVPVDEHAEEGEHGEEPEDEHGALTAPALYLPQGAGMEPERAFLENRDSTRFGLDFNLFYKDLNLFGAYVSGEDDLRVFAEGHDGGPGALLDHESGDFSYDAWFLEADAVLRYPWLHGALRYETVDLPAPGVEDFERATASVTGLIRANVKTTLEYTWDLNDSDNYFFWLNFGIAF